MVELHLVDIFEVDVSKGAEAIHWRLLTSHQVGDFGMAHLMLDFYRKRWIIEEYFRTLKSAGFKIENAKMSDPRAFMNFAALAAIAAVTVTQMLRARDNTSGQALGDAFDPDDEPLLLALCKGYEGETPTSRQKNPHPPDALVFATWVKARLGAWTGDLALQHSHVASGVITRSNTVREYQLQVCESDSYFAGGLPSNKEIRKPKKDNAEQVATNPTLGAKAVESSKQKNLK
jgi:hypothetical protein